MAYVSGGQGLWSTVDDYLAFARMFVGGGAVDGVRLLRPETFRRMVTNQLTAAQRATAEVTGMPLFAAGHGFGLGVAVVMEPEQALAIVCGGGVGAVGWPGGFGGWWQADPNDGSVLIFLTHNMVEPGQLERGSGSAFFGRSRSFRRWQRPRVRPRPKGWTFQPPTRNAPHRGGNLQHESSIGSQPVGAQQQCAGRFWRGAPHAAGMDYAAAVPGAVPICVPLAAGTPGSARRDCLPPAG